MRQSFSPALSPLVSISLFNSPFLPVLSTFSSTCSYCSLSICLLSLSVSPTFLLHCPSLLLSRSVSLGDLDPEEMERMLGGALGRIRGRDPRRAPITNYAQDFGSLLSLTEEEAGPDPQRFSLLEVRFAPGARDWTTCLSLRPKNSKCVV